MRIEVSSGIPAVPTLEENNSCNGVVADWLNGTTLSTQNNCTYNE